MGFISSTIGFPRMGRNRELKRVLERYWKGNATAGELEDASRTIQRQAWSAQKDAGISLVGLDGTLYDQVLDWIFYLGLAPPRFQHLSGLDLYFAMARGVEGVPALDMSKFFDTNYHYMVPELDDASNPIPNFAPFLTTKVANGQDAIGKECAVPIVLGPVTLVQLASCKTARPAMVAKLVPVYRQLLAELKKLNVPEVQMHEPALVFGNANELKEPCEAAYKSLCEVGLPVNLVTYYDDIGDAYSWVTGLPVSAVSLDFCGVPGAEVGSQTLELIKKFGFPKDKRLGAGLVDGRSVWDSQGPAAKTLAELQSLGISSICVQSSVSLQHLPYTIKDEKKLPTEVLGRLAFGVEKLSEIVKVARGEVPESNVALQKSANQTIDPKLFDRPVPYAERRKQQISTPAFPTSTIGSFPQTSEIRSLRLKFKKGEISEEEYKHLISSHIAYAIGIQDAIGLDVLVHGEAERTDMVEYFGQKLEGMYFTDNGWVQSYGSRCIRPPVIVGDIRRTATMTVVEYKIAQSLTKRPVKGMLTGPVTILNWSFPRKDLSRKAQAMQLALALREEVKDLELAGCKVIQVDEPAIREGLPLKNDRWNSYLSWAVDAFRLCCGVAAPATQIVTHMCYSDFQDILNAIDRMDADVLTIENSRSGNEMIHALANYNYSRDLGPGVYDVHSPVVPSVDFIITKIKSFVESHVLEGKADRIWVNPDCGLKTRDWKEVIPSLKNMVEAARIMRGELAVK